MNRITSILVLLVLLIGCTKTDPICMNEPPHLQLVIKENSVQYLDFVPEQNLIKKEAILYKIVDGEKVKIKDLFVHNDDIYILLFSTELKKVYTNELETFYIEHNEKAHTLQIRGTYHDSTGCGDYAYLDEIYFNNQKISIK